MGLTPTSFPVFLFCREGFGPPGENVGAWSFRVIHPPPVWVWGPRPFPPDIRKFTPPSRCFSPCENLDPLVLVPRLPLQPPLCEVMATSFLWPPPGVAATISSPATGLPCFYPQLDISTVFPTDPLEGLLTGYFVDPALAFRTPAKSTILVAYWREWSPPPFIFPPCLFFMVLVR